MTNDKTLILNNGAVERHIETPDVAGSYSGVRFSRAGNMTRLYWNGIDVCGAWRDAGTASCSHDAVRGKAGEFGMGACGMPAPLGFDAAKPGETFVKPGVGVLLKTDDECYQFARDY
jgi:hypothetical protein